MELMSHFSLDFSAIQMSTLSLEVSKKTTLRMELTATVTMIDMISNIGGTLGLFLGFSFLSGVEVIYWIVKSVMPKQRQSRMKKMNWTRK